MSGLVHLNINADLLRCLPKEFSMLHSLRILYLQAPSLTSLPKNLGKLSNMQDLELMECEILSSLPDSIGHLLQLTSFETRGCQDLASLPHSICQCTS
ncbi:hypothetical protein CLOP_g7847 [Closterium sp. NIES-67]|nr:hypothetical protein CLOP_g7847 [Closterium sp. NIES-67]